MPTGKKNEFSADQYFLHRNWRELEEDGKAGNPVELKVEEKEEGVPSPSNLKWGDILDLAEVGAVAKKVEGKEDGPPSKLKLKIPIMPKKKEEEDTSSEADVDANSRKEEKEGSVPDWWFWVSMTQS